MSRKLYIGIDNGNTGTIGWIGENTHGMVETPVKVEQSYTKKAQKMTRIDHVRLAELFREVQGGCDPSEVLVVMERPFTGSFTKGKNGGRGGFVANVSAARAFEVTRCLVEQAHFAYEIVDSKQWQKKLLPYGIKGSDNLKAASKDIGLRLFPDLEGVIKKHKDADGILMAEYARREQL